MTPTQVPTPIGFTFDPDQEGWVYLTAPPLSAPIGVGSPAGPGSTGTLDIRATNNVNNFGFWQSPTIELVSGGSPGTGGSILLPVGSVNGSNTLRAKFRVFSDQADASLVPEFRLRSSAENSQQSDVLNVDSLGKHSLTPSDTLATEPALIWRPAAGSPRFNLELDLVNFMPEDAATGVIKLDAVTLDVLPPSMFAAPRLERDFTFGSSTEEFSYKTIPQFTAATSSYDQANGRLAMQVEPIPTSAAIPFEFSWWGSLESGPNAVHPFPNRLYFADFSVESNIADAAVVPSFRCRLNETTFQAAQFVQVASTGNGANSPTVGSPKTYRVFFPPNMDSGSNFLIFSWDMFTGSFDGDSTNGTIYLTNVKVMSVDAP